GQGDGVVIQKSDRRRQGQRLQAARYCVSRLRARSRVTTSRPDRVVAQAIGSRARQKDQLWNLGMGRAIEDGQGRFKPRSLCERDRGEDSRASDLEDRYRESGAPRVLETA